MIIKKANFRAKPAANTELESIRLKLELSLFLK